MHNHAQSNANRKVELENFGKICQWLQQRAGLHFPASKQASLLNRLYQLCMQNNIPDIYTLHQYMQDDSIPGLRIKLLDTATTNHTFFFREEKVWDYFKANIIPTFPANQPVRIWSAASSSGEEAYTFAIYLAEHFNTADLQNRASILGTDISQTALTIAEAGCYKPTVIHTVPENIRSKYFHQTPDKMWQVNDNLRRACMFRRLNLKANPWPFNKQFNLIACRNVLYYFDTVDQKEVLSRMYQQTIKGGWLLTSVTESIRELNSPWKMVTAGIYRKE
ncbi:MAG: protein-glutamate O-methyltransferase CheR [Gammaproteobacteria bacterium]